ncbi:MAG: cytochrome c-type biogenesis protein CcmH [Anaerolineales bacterium]|nr:cytochrome c-type biogenesis protein CcmH [Anaerolineales bacterium]
MRNLRIWLLALLVVVAVYGAAPPKVVLAQDNGPQPTPSDDEVNAIAREMYCPVCENIPLDVCGTQACAQWREQIREKLAEGWTEDQIKDYFVQLYGDRVLSEPPRRGLNWVIYIVPGLAFVVGAYVLYRGIKTWTAPVVDEPESEEMADTGAEEKDEYISKLEEELKKRG